MKIIGLTGGIGSGKSTVLRMFQEFGVETYIADVEAKKLMKTNIELKLAIQKLIGENAYVGNELNPKFIATQVFNNSTKLTALNKLVHPKVQEHFKNFIKKLEVDIVIYEAAILFESGSDKLCDFTITVVSSLEDRIARVMKRDGVSKNEIIARINNQSTDELKIKKSTFVINNHSLEHTKQQVATILDLIRKMNLN